MDPASCSEISVYNCHSTRRHMSWDLSIQINSVRNLFSDVVSNVETFIRI